jgi:hypothetical protein
MSTRAAATAITMVRRTLIAVGGAAVMAAMLRLRGTGGVPPRSGGWRELTVDDFAGTDDEPSP